MKIGTFCIQGHEGFLKKCFFQKPYRIILGPPKNVLHLVCSVLGISTAIKIALNVALYDCFGSPLAHLNGQFMGKVDHDNRTKQMMFLVGLSVKSVCQSYIRFLKPIGGNF